jgi:hypothetical protein
MKKEESSHRLIYVLACFIFLFSIACACSGSTITTIPQNIGSSQANIIDPTNTIENLNTTQIVPTDTQIPPTNTPDNRIKSGTYLVGTDIQPGYYKGIAGDNLMESCYWARLSDVSGSFDSIIANDNSVGRFYIRVKETDFALETKCTIEYLPSLPPPATEFPIKINMGTYLVGIDIQFGTYRGQAGEDIMESCYWARLNDVTGGFDAIITNDNATGQFYVQVKQTDFALQTKCELERIGD